MLPEISSMKTTPFAPLRLGAGTGASAASGRDDRQVRVGIRLGRFLRENGQPLLGDGWDRNRARRHRRGKRGRLAHRDRMIFHRLDIDRRGTGWEGIGSKSR